MKSKNNNIYLDPSIQFDGRLRQAQLRMLSMLEVVDKICLKHGLNYWLDRGTLLGAVRHNGFIAWDDDVDISMPRPDFETFLSVATTELPEGMWLQTSATDPGYFNLAAPLKIRDLNSRFIEKHEKGNEPYRQGIFIDVFAYDIMPNSTVIFNVYKFIGKKLLRLLGTKCSLVEVGHHASTYKALGKLFTKTLLTKLMHCLIKKADKSNSSYIGYGYDSTKKIKLHKSVIFPLKRIKFETTELSCPHESDLMLKQIYGDYLTLPPEHKRRPNHCRELYFK